MDREIPHAWIGQTVYVGLLVPTTGSAPPSGTIEIGKLHSVTQLGIVGVFASGDEDEPVRSFYSWSAVLSISSEDDVADLVGIR